MDKLPSVMDKVCCDPYMRATPGRLRWTICPNPRASISAAVSARLPPAYPTSSPAGRPRNTGRDFDLGVVEWRVLAQLAAEPWSTGAQLSQTIGLDKASISRSLRLLEDRELICVRSASGRRQEAALSRKGWAMHAEVLEVARAREAALLEGFTEAEVDTLIALLQRLLANLPAIEADAARRAARPRRAPAQMQAKAAE